MATTMSSSTSTTFQHSTAISLALARLKELGINFLAFDFDQTILDVHTGGRWKEPMEELFVHVRPVFAQLIQAAVEDPELKVAIVTFTPQTSLVRGVLDHMVGTEASQDIPIRGGDRSWQYKGVGSFEGKQPHMASAVEEIQSRQEGFHVTKATTLLIDDDARNVRYALHDGTRAIWFNPNKPHLLLQDIMKLV